MVEYTKRGLIRQRGEHDHLYLRNGTYYFFFRYPKFWTDWWINAGVPQGASKARVEHSLKTSDHAEAVRMRDRELAHIRAELATFKSFMALKDKVGTRTSWRQEPYGPKVDHGDGVFSIANDEQIIFVDANGTPLRDRKTLPNACWEEPNRGKETTPEHEALKEKLFDTLAVIDTNFADRRGKKLASKQSRDDEIIEFWSKNVLSVDIKRLAKQVYSDLRELFPGVTLETATHWQAVKLAELYRDRDKVLAFTAMQKVRWLSTIMRKGKKIGRRRQSIRGR